MIISHLPSILCSFIVGIIPLFLFNISILSKSKHLLNLLLCFASGSLLADAIGHLYHDHHHSLHHHHPNGSYLLAGIFAFFLLDRIAKIFQTCHYNIAHSSSSTHHTHNLLIRKKKRAQKSNVDSHGNDQDHDHDNDRDNDHLHLHSHSRHDIGIGSGGYLSLIADAIHNFTDGIAIASSFKNGIYSGLATSFAIFVHEIPHNIGKGRVVIIIAIIFINLFSCFR